MYSQTDLDEAVAAGAVSAESAAALRDYVARQNVTSAVDEEHFRLLSGFNDIFVSVAAAILLFAVAFIGQRIGPRLDGQGPSPLAGLFVAATAWGLALFFTAKRRMALPSILLLLAFVGGIFAAAGTLAMMVVGTHALDNNPQLGAAVGSVAAAVSAVAAYVHWRRFRVPITVAAGAAAVAGIALGLLLSLIGGDIETVRPTALAATLVLGIGMFLLAMRWDSSDPARATRRSDVAFWLHLLAAPMIVHPIFALLGLNDGHATIGEGVLVVLLYIGLGVTALAIDRRALLVSSLAYVLWALSDLFKRFGAVELNVALTALVIGSSLLLLSAFWHQARAAVVRPLPEALRSRLPLTDRPVMVPQAA